MTSSNPIVTSTIAEDDVRFPSGNVIAAGNVGIGTTIPRSILDIYRVTGQFNDNSSFKVLLTPNQSNNTVVATSRLQWYSQTFDTSIFRGSGADISRVGFILFNQERMSITAAGNVGIGTATPASNLHVNGNMIVGSGSPQSYNHIRMGGGNSNGYLFGSFPGLADGIILSYNHYYNESGAIQYVNPGVGANNANIQVGYGLISFRTGSNGVPPTTRMTINTAGNVGIGTNNPGNKLDVYSEDSSNRTALRLITEQSPSGFGNSLNGCKINLSARQNNGTVRPLAFIEGVDDKPNDSVEAGLRFSTFNNGTETERMRIRWDGNVGVGTTTPAVKLQVNGAVIGTPNIYTPANAGTVTLDLGAFSNHIITHGGSNLTLANPINQIVGSSGQIVINTNGTSRTISFGTNWKFPNGVVPSLSITNTYDVISYFVPANGVILTTFVNDFS